MTSLILLTWSVLLLYGVSGYRLVCVYTNWSQYRPDGGKFLPEDVDPSMCTHLIYVYAKLQGNRLVAAEWNDDGTAWKEGMYQRVNALKQHNPDLKTLLGVGGWMMGSKDFSRMASTTRSRRMFAKSAATFLRERGFDGLTIDWQHPTKRGGRPKDRVNFSLLLQAVRREFEDEGIMTQQPPLLLVAGVSASKYIIDSAYEIQNISKYTDFINVFAYDLHGPWDNYTGHPSQLYARDDELGPAAEINIDASMKYWISNGIDRSKLVLGISTYGRTFTLKEPRYNGYMVPSSGPGNAGEFTREPGMIAYYERCSQYFDAPRVWDKQSKVAYWYSGDQWIAGEDIESVKHKVYWARQNGVDGFMMWTLDTDDFNGSCNTTKYTLHMALKDELDFPTQPPTTLPPTDITVTPEPVAERDTKTSPTARPTTKRVSTKKTVSLKRKVAKVTKPPQKKVNNKQPPKTNPNTNAQQSPALTKKSVQKSNKANQSAKNNKNIQLQTKKTTKTSKATNDKPSKQPLLGQTKETKTVVKTQARDNINSKISKKVNTDISKKDNSQSKVNTIAPSPKDDTSVKAPTGIKSTAKPTTVKTTKDVKRKRVKGRRRRLTKAQRLRIIQHRRRMMLRKANAKKKTATAKPKTSQANTEKKKTATAKPKTSQANTEKKNTAQ